MEKRGQAGDTVGNQGITGTIDFHELVGVDNVKPTVCKPSHSNWQVCQNSDFTSLGEK